VNPIYNRAKQLKQALLEFVLDAEGDLAIALETYSAQHLNRFTKSHYQGTAQTDLIVDRFLTQGYVNDQTPLDLFLAAHSDLNPADRQLLVQWTQSFTGLFLVEKTVGEDGFELKNWLTAKQYL
jgi:Na+-transporting NADH:ubiquinone oxidoreductase subunit NqrA